MKKYLIIISVILTIISQQNKSSAEIIIPDEAIRFRVVAKDNTKESQDTKLLVKNALTKELTNLLKDSKSIKDTKRLIKNNQPILNNIIKETLLTNQTSTTYNLNYGLNYFPKKKYKGIIYEEGYYESLVVTLGNGLGENWWCVLFPPLCFIDNETTISDREYRSFIKDTITKYYH